MVQFVQEEQLFFVYCAHPDGVIDLLSSEEYLRFVGVTASASAAFDILTDNGMAPEKAWPMARAAQKLYDEGSTWPNPEAQARHFVRLSRALRG